MKKYVLIAKNVTFNAVKCLKCCCLRQFLLYLSKLEEVQVAFGTQTRTNTHT